MYKKLKINFLDKIELFIFASGLIFSTFSVSGVLICGGILLAITIFKSIRHKNFTNFIGQPELIILIAFLFFNSIFRMNFKRDEIFALTKIIFHLSFLFIHLPSYQRYRKEYSAVFLLSSISSNILSLYVILTSGETRFLHRGFTLLPGIQETAGIIFFFIVFEISFLFFSSPGRKWLFAYLTLSVILKTAAIVLTFSRTYFLALCLLFTIIIFTFIYQYLKNRRLKRGYFVLTILSLVIMFSLALFLGPHKRIKYLFDLKYSTNHQRVCMWKTAFQKIVESPVFGQGVQYFASQFSSDILKQEGCKNKNMWIGWVFKDKRWIKKTIGSIKHPHNLYLYITVSGGIVALVLYLLVLFRIFKTFRFTLFIRESEISYKWLGIASLIYFFIILFTASNFDRHPFLDPLLSYPFASSLWLNRCLCDFTSEDGDGDNQ